MNKYLVKLFLSNTFLTLQLLLLHWWKICWQTLHVAETSSCWDSNTPWFYARACFGTLPSHQVSQTAFRDISEKYYFFSIGVLHSLVDQSFHIQWSAIMIHKKHLKQICYLRCGCCIVLVLDLANVSIY